MDIANKLDQLAEARAQRDALALRKQTAVDAVLTPEIRTQLAAIDVEFSQQTGAIDANIAEMEAGIKLAVLAAGSTVKGTNLQAVYNKGRVTWDAKILDGYSLTHPEILYARREGEPSITIRQGGAK